MQIVDLLNLEEVFDCEKSWKRTVSDKRFHMDIPFSQLIAIYREHWNDVNSSMQRDISFEGMLSQDDIEKLIERTKNN